MAETPMEAIRYIADRVRDNLLDMGIEMVGYSVVPNMDGVGPDIMQIVFALKPDALLSPEERKAKKDSASIDATFEAMMSGVEEDIEVDKTDEQIEAAKADTMDLLKGFMDDK